MSGTSDCLEYLEALESGRLESREFREHLASCSCCRQGLESLGALKKCGSVYSPGPAGEVKVKNRIMEEIARPEAGSLAGTSTGISTGTILAGTLLAGAILAGAILFRGSSAPPVASPGVKTPSPPSVASGPIPGFIDIPAASGAGVSAGAPISTVSLPLAHPDRE